jgi:hypothetical protein
MFLTDICSDMHCDILSTASCREHLSSGSNFLPAADFHVCSPAQIYANYITRPGLPANGSWLCVVHAEFGLLACEDVVLGTCFPRATRP